MMLKEVLFFGVTALLTIESECKSIQNDSVNSELADLKQTVMDLSVKVHSLNESLQQNNNHVMFYAIIKGKHLLFNVDSILVFETVIINEGGHYDQYDGIFVAPEKGIYLFSWTATGLNAKWIITELVVEEKIISSAGEKASSSGDRPSGSMTALCKMDKGDHAWIRTTGISADQQIYSQNDQPETAFLGILMRNE